MAPKSLDFSEEFSNYVPEDKDQRLVKTPYGKGIVIRTRNDDDQQGDVDKEAISMKEIELSDWTKPELKNGKDVSSFNSNSNKPHMLYTPIKFPSVSPVVGSEVLTQWGRGKVTEIRDDVNKTHVVKLSSWRLASRSSVFCYVSAKECEVMRPYRIYDMDVFDKVENANDLKQDATAKFKKKDYDGALRLFARAVDAVRYVQHGAGSTNELRADLIVVMITCSNNAALCSSKKEDWERAAKFGANALVLIEALEEKGDKSKIKKILNNDGIGDSQLFGTWKVKSLLIMAKSQMERHDASKMTNALKKALEAITVYKKEGDSMHKQLSTQEKDIRRLRLEFSNKTKAARIKEKQRARAMFGGNEEEKKDFERKEMPASQSPTPITGAFSASPLQTPSQQLYKSETESSYPTVTMPDEGVSSETKAEKRKSLKKKVTFADADEISPAPVDVNEDEDEDYSQPSFFEEHSEALFIISGIAIGWLVVNMVTKKR